MQICKFQFKLFFKLEDTDLQLHNFQKSITSKFQAYTIITTKFFIEKKNYRSESTHCVPNTLKCSTNWCSTVLYIMPTHWSFYIYGNNSKLKCRVMMSLKSSSQIVKFKTPRTGVQALRLMKTFYWLSYII